MFFTSVWIIKRKEETMREKHNSYKKKKNPSNECINENSLMGVWYSGFLMIGFQMVYSGSPLITSSHGL